MKIVGFSLITLGYVFGDQPIVNQIVILGNEVTQEYIIRREIQHKTGIPLDSVIATEDRNRIENLGIFSEVLWTATLKPDSTILLKYIVIESWRFFPGLMPYYDEETGWSVSGGLIINNFRGRNESLSVGGQFGGKQSYGAQYYDPWIFGDHISLELNGDKLIRDHPFLDFELEKVAMAIKVGRYFGYEKRAKVGLAVENRSFTSDSTSLEFRHLTPQFDFTFDTRDIYSDPSRGTHIQQALSWVLDNSGDRKNLFYWTQSVSLFRTIIPVERRLTAGFNLSGQFVFGALEEVWTDYLGGAFSVRGWQSPKAGSYLKNDQQFRFGYQWLVTSLEFRQTIIPKYATVFQNEFGLTVAAFLDVGLINDSLNDLLKTKPLFGAGFGIRIPWPVIQVIRLDYGWAYYNGEQLEQSFHLAFGQKF